MQPTQPTAELVLGIKVRGLKLAKCFYLQNERQALYTAIPYTLCTGSVLHSFISNKMGGKYVDTWVHYS